MNGWGGRTKYQYRQCPAGHEDRLTLPPTQAMPWDILRKELINIALKQRSLEGHWHIWTNNVLTWCIGPMKDRKAARPGYLHVPSINCVRLTTHAQRTYVVSIEEECCSHSLKLARGQLMYWTWRLVNP